MGRGPGVQTRLGFEVTAISDGTPDGQQPVAIFRDGTDVSSGETETLLGDFNQVTTVPPLVSADGNVVIFPGTNTEDPSIGGVAPVGTNAFQRRFKFAGLGFNSPGEVFPGLPQSATVGCDAGTASIEVVEESGQVKTAYKITFTNLQNQSVATFNDNGSGNDVGCDFTCDNPDTHYDQIGIGKFNNNNVWVLKSFRGGAFQTKVMSTNTVCDDVEFLDAADVLIHDSIDLSMASTYANTSCDVSNKPEFSTGSYPIITDNPTVFSAVTYNGTGEQLSYDDQTTAGLDITYDLNTKNLYSYPPGMVGEDRYNYGSYDWTKSTGGTTVSPWALGIDTSDTLEDGNVDVKVRANPASNANTVGDTIQGAIGYALYDLNANTDVDKGFGFVTYSVAGDIKATTAPNAPSKVTYSSTFLTGTLGRTNGDSSSAICDDLPTVTEENGSVQTTVCGGDIAGSTVTLDVSF